MFPTSRGANTAEEFVRQRTKIISAIGALDAAVVGLMEIENDGYASDSAIHDLVDGLNQAAGSGTWTFSAPASAVQGTDAIAQKIIYKPAVVRPVGSIAVLDSSVDAEFDDTKNRPTLAQTFEDIATGTVFTVAVNHLKSKVGRAVGPKNRQG